MYDFTWDKLDGKGRIKILYFPFDAGSKSNRFYKFWKKIFKGVYPIFKGSTPEKIEVAQN